MTMKRVVIENEEEPCDNSDVEDNRSTDDLTDDESESNIKKNVAWADSVSKILRSKPKTNKPLVLCKAKKLTEVKKKPKEVGFEVVLGDGEIKGEIIEEKPEERKEQTKHKEKKKKEIPGLRVKPDILEKDRERVLSRIATRGVVQLFNAVRNQQLDINKKLKEAGPLEVRKEKVMKSIDKNTFLDVLMGQKSQVVDDVLENNSEHSHKKRKLEEKEESSEKVWNVLRDNYMMDAKMKDWDKELEIEEELETE